MGRRQPSSNGCATCHAVAHCSCCAYLAVQVMSGMKSPQQMMSEMVSTSSSIAVSAVAAGRAAHRHVSPCAHEGFETGTQRWSAYSPSHPAQRSPHLAAVATLITAVTTPRYSTPKISGHTAKQLPHPPQQSSVVLTATCCCNCCLQMMKQAMNAMGGGKPG